ncbi:MAG: M23 family metallopeptidase [Chloroflexi bacterium]|nr:M23 family metallopeptidase [Chloroflexota bacterium]
MVNKVHMNGKIAHTQLAIGIILVMVLVFSLLPSRRVFAQTASPFLISPYFGRETVSQWYSTDHPAIDFGSMDFDRVLAGEDGNIGQVRWYNNSCHQSDSNPACGYGLYIRIDHSNNYQTYYAHLSATAFGLSGAGTQVKRGQIIATSGHTGWSTGPHLHFEVRHNGVNVDPFNENGVSLWIDGEWANPSRPIPEPVNGGEIIVDDTTDNTGGFSKGSGGPFNNPCTGNCGGWTRTTTTGYGGDMYYTLADAGTAANQWARWQAPAGALLIGNLYEVYVHVPDDHATSWQAPYTIA